MKRILIKGKVKNINKNKCENCVLATHIHLFVARNGTIR